MRLAWHVTSAGRRRFTGCRHDYAGARGRRGVPMSNPDPVDVRKLLAPLPVKESWTSRAVRRLNLPSRLVAGVIAVVVVVGILLVAFGVDFPSKLQAVDTVKTFCGAETDGKYDVAYGLDRKSVV